MADKSLGPDREIEITGLIELLKKVENRVFMYFGPAPHLRSVQTILGGIQAACYIFNCVYDVNIELQVYRKHGLSREPDGIEPQLIALDLQEDAIVKKVKQHFVCKIVA